MRDKTAVARKLRQMADQIEAETLGALTLDALGHIFGNEFWGLIYYDLLDSVRRKW